MIRSEWKEFVRDAINLNLSTKIDGRLKKNLSNQPQFIYKKSNLISIALAP